jgi:hypothetical protein
MVRTPASAEPLVTGDQRIAKFTGLSCAVRLLG